MSHGSAGNNSHRHISSETCYSGTTGLEKFFFSFSKRAYMTPTKTNKTNTINQTYKPKPFTKGASTEGVPNSEQTSTEESPKVLSYGRRFYGRSDKTTHSSSHSCGRDRPSTAEPDSVLERTSGRPSTAHTAAGSPTPIRIERPSSSKGVTKAHCDKYLRRELAKYIAPPPHATKALPKTLRVIIKQEADAFW